MEGVNPELLASLFFRSWWMWQPFKNPTAKAQTARARGFKAADISHFKE